ncbi:MAG: hypothetical protein U0163_15330 [Gemmatimonadaceae bacterium]
MAKQYACKLFVDMPSGRGQRAALAKGDHELEVTFDTATVPQFGLWLNKHGWTAR